MRELRTNLRGCQWECQAYKQLLHSLDERPDCSPGVASAVAKVLAAVERRRASGGGGGGGSSLDDGSGQEDGLEGEEAEFAPVWTATDETAAAKAGGGRGGRNLRPSSAPVKRKPGGSGGSSSSSASGGGPLRPGSARGAAVPVQRARPGSAKSRKALGQASGGAGGGAAVPAVAAERDALIEQLAALGITLQVTMTLTLMLIIMMMYPCVHSCCPHLTLLPIWPPVCSRAPGAATKPTVLGQQTTIWTARSVRRSLTARSLFHGVPDALTQRCVSAGGASVRPGGGRASGAFSDVSSGSEWDSGMCCACACACASVPPTPAPHRSSRADTPHDSRRCGGRPSRRQRG